MNLDNVGSNEKFHNLFTAIFNGIAIYSSTDGLNFIVTAMNSAGEQMVSVTLADISGREIREVFPGVVEMGLYDVLRRVWISGTAENLPVAFYDDQRISRYYENHVYRISATEVAAVYCDITDQKIAVDELRKSETRFRTLFETMQEGFALYEVICDAAGRAIDFRYLEINPAFEHLTGLTRDLVIGRRLREVLPQLEDHWIENFGRVALSGEPAEFESFSQDLGRDYHVQAYSPKAGKLAVVFDDVSARRQKEALLIASEKKFRMLFEHSADPSLLIVGNTFVDCNQAAVDILQAVSKDDVLNTHPSDLSPEYQPDERLSSEKAAEMIATAVSIGSHRFEWVHRRLNGELFPVEVLLTKIQEGDEIIIFTVWRDITERKRAEEERLKLEQQLLHAQKLESLGVLAGGIAHDFNNILMVIIGNADLALMRINLESPAVENLHNIEQAAARAAELAKQMLAYSGKGKFVIEQLNLNLLIEDMLHMLEVSISKHAVLRLNLAKNLPSVEADATQIRQIVMNLVINASEAIGDKSGVIAITTGCMDCDYNYLEDVWLDENLVDGLYVYLEIADTGCGMDPETKAKVFDPFFTTKFTGRGLGMAAVLGIVRGHKGAIKIYSELDKGTTFKILLPASDRPAELFNHRSPADNWQGSGTVLLVDDEETIRGIGVEMLKVLGFTAITANDGREALKIFRNNPEIDLVLLDLTMPHMDGEQCFRELRQIKSDVKVIISSGYNEHEVTQKFVGKGLAGFIQKPYKLSELKEVIKKCTGMKFLQPKS